MFTKLLIANRGEIACRIIKTARRLGIESIAVYSTVDKQSPHVALADKAVCIGNPEAKQSYLNSEKLILAALEHGAEAIHPGYGFLSENPAFARAVLANGLVFVGPTATAMEAMASKQLAKQRLEKTGVPLTPGYHGKDQSDERLFSESKQIGFPILLKPANGGGGKGMHTVYDETAFYDALASARREANLSFGDETMIIEAFIQNPRHIEIQIMADNHGHLVHLYERDCSIQRRHQKIVEEAPALHLPSSLRSALTEAAMAVARAIDYRGAGTVEFLMDTEKRFYFMEMNTRLQVEHPVTEMITGLDLVEWQLRIAANEPLPLTQTDISIQGHAIECRLYAEDPDHDFLPSIGMLSFLKEPDTPGIRIDSGVKNNTTISRYYDPMIAKLIAYGETREQALQRMQLALNHYHVGGVKTNIPFLRSLLAHPAFVNAKLNTTFLTDHPLHMPKPNGYIAALFTASVAYLKGQMAFDPLYQETVGWRMHLPSCWTLSYLFEGEPQTLTIIPQGLHTLEIQFKQEKRCMLEAWFIKDRLYVDDGQQQYHAWVETVAGEHRFYTDSGQVVVKSNQRDYLSSQPSSNHALVAPMPALVVAVLKKKGDKIKTGERLIILEAMKMEHTICAPETGKILDIFCEIGTQVNEGDELIAIKHTASESQELG